MDCSPPSSSVHGIFQARILEWAAISFSNPGIKSPSPAMAGRFFTTESPEKPTIEYCSAIKEGNNAICSNMDGPRDCHTEWSKSYRERKISWHPLCVESKRKWYKWTYKTEKLTDLENELTVAGGRGGGQGERIVREFGINIYTLLLKWITTKDLLCITWNLLSVMWQPGWEGSLGKNGYMYMYSWVASQAIS